ncbi:MAG: family 10 glycosylhydrolase [Gemmatimonadetes bacterium]|nr:family 10 glycosylhydrolase [Gemmatimonadota bacterium]
MRRWKRAVALIALAAACRDASAPPGTPSPPAGTAEPVLTREFRGMWIATVANIDFPTASALPVATQRAELIALLDLAQSLRFTAVILQVRAAGDALYASAIEPWSASLAGAQGSDPGWDPLAVAVTEAHARGLELHAWFNPFRAGNASDTLRLHAKHLGRVRRDLTRVVRGSLWFDPGEPEVQAHVLQVVRDVLTRYDVDAIHLDDFFYPYPTTGTPIPVPFPDSATYARYASSVNSPLPVEDWRRDNVNRFVQGLYQAVRAFRPQVKVGISPFGIWRPGNPGGITGLDAWRDIYADSRHWLQQGWVDYLAPQLYWSIASTGQSFPLLNTWWQAQNLAGRHVWPGLAAYRVADGTASAYLADEIINQISVLRTNAAAPGFLLYNATSLRRDRGGLTTFLKAGPTRGDAISPSYPWLDPLPPDAPTITVDATTIRVTPANGEAPAWWIIHTFDGTAWTQLVRPGTVTSFARNGAQRVRVRAADRAFNLSTAARWP